MQPRSFLTLFAAAALSLVATAASSRQTVSINFGWRVAPDPAGPAHGGDAHGPAVNSTAPPPDAKQAALDFDDSGWEVVDIPHDASVTGGYASTENGGEGFLPLARTWYRKHFLVPAEWTDKPAKAVTLVVDASLSTTTWYLNGKQIIVQNPVGYLPTVVTLEVRSGANLLVAYVDGGLTTGWWWAPVRHLNALRSFPPRSPELSTCTLRTRLLRANSAEPATQVRRVRADTCGASDRDVHRSGCRAVRSV
jgi:hypothetical protein